MWPRFETWLIPAVTVAVAGLWLVTRLSPESDARDAEAGHHGGRFVSLGHDEFHVEAVFEPTGRLSLYTLAADETVVLDVQTQMPTAYVRAAGSSQSSPVTLKSAPQAGDGPGRTSRFVAQLPSDLAGRAVDVSVPNLRIGSRRFHLAFASTDHASESDMPAKILDEQERDLYLTAGGRYTEADIEANRRLTASQKFRGFVAKHDRNPQRGDRICPITQTKANRDCTWIVAGREYAFCCPPCVDEFVRLAKESPEEIQPPERYVRD